MNGELNYNPKMCRRGLTAAWTGWFCCVVSTLLLFWKTESAVITGPIIFIVGVLTIRRGWAGRYLPLLLAGLFNCLICVLFTGLVNLLSWAPSDADVPFEMMGTAYTLASLVLVVWLQRNCPRNVDPLECRRCGYQLYGLQDPRCPECGEPFDASLLGVRPEE